MAENPSKLSLITVVVKGISPNEAKTFPLAYKLPRNNDESSELQQANCIMKNYPASFPFRKPLRFVVPFSSTYIYRAQYTPRAIYSA